MGYPYPRPASSYIFANGRSLLFEGWTRPKDIHDLEVSLSAQWDFAREGPHPRAGGAPLALREALSLAGVPAGWGVEDWTPVLAIGSNAAPAQLARKFPPEMFGGEVVVPVVRARLEDFDVVYAPLVTSYGSCAATLEHCPGTTVELYVTFLSPPLLERMHETEGAYNLCELRGVSLDLGGGACLDTVYQYNHQAGTLAFPLPGEEAPGPVALAEIQAQGRVFPARTQVEMLAHVMAHVGGGEGAGAAAEILERWIVENLEVPEVRKGRVDELLRMARPFTYPGSKVLGQLGSVHSANIK